MAQAKLYLRLTEENFPDYVFLIGMDEATAATELNKRGKTLHVAKRDDVDQHIKYKNINCNRVNVVVVAGKIIGVDDIH